MTKMTFAVRTCDDLGLAIDRLRSARDRGVRWMLGNMRTNGEPHDADKGTGWGRAPWALAIAGETDAASAMIAWAERTGRFGADGDFAQDEPLNSKDLRSYWLAHYAAGAWWAGAHGIACRTLNAVRAYQDDFGGVAFSKREAIPYTELMCTSQLGICALMMGETGVAKSCWQWIKAMMAQQERLAEKVLYTFCAQDILVTDVPPDLAFFGVVDFTKARQAYFYAGIAAAFCGQYAQTAGDAEALSLAEQFLLLSKEGTAAQFNDPGSVQICKYPWGIACLVLACPTKLDAWLPELTRMAHWFADWQTDDGSWVPSVFLTPEPTVVHRWTKTCEHVMEVSIMLQALGYAKAFKRADPVRKGA